MDLALLGSVLMGALAIGAALSAAPDWGFAPMIAAGAGLLVLVLIGAWLDQHGARPSSVGREGVFHYLGTAGVGAALLLVTFNGARPTPGATLADLLLVLGAGCLFLHLLSTPSRLPAVPLWLGGAAYAILAIGIISALAAPSVVLRTLLTPTGASGVTFPVSSDFGEDVLAAGRLSLTLLLVPLLISIVADSRVRLERMVDLWLTSAVVCSLIALADGFVGTSIGEQITGVVLGAQRREAGLTVHPNHLSTVAAMALPVAFSRATTASVSLRRWLYWASVGVLAGGIGVSGSRAGILAGALGVLLILLFQRHERKRTIAGLAIAGVVAALLVTTVIGPSSLRHVSVGIERLAGGEGSAQVEASNTARRVAYASAVEDFTRHPLTGTGFGGVREAHNLYLQLLQGGGVFLLCAFGLFALGALRLGHRLSRNPRFKGDMQSLALALTVSLAVWLIAGLVQTPVYDRYLYVPVGFLLGLALAARTVEGPPRANARPTAPDAKAT